MFDYNTRNELTRADRWQGTAQTTHTAAPFAFEYAYDPIGNRETFTADDNPTSTSYDPNSVNQYEATIDPSESFDYDDDGNMTADGTYAYTWDGENRLIGDRGRKDRLPGLPSLRTVRAVLPHTALRSVVHRPTD